MKLHCVACEAFLAFHLLMFYSPFQLSLCCIFVLSSQNYLVSFFFFFNLVSECAVLAICLRPQYNTSCFLSGFLSLPCLLGGLLLTHLNPAHVSSPSTLHFLCVLYSPHFSCFPRSSYVFELFLHSWAGHFLRQMTVL